MSEKLISNNQEPALKKAHSESKNSSKKLQKNPKVTNKDRSNAHCINSLVGKRVTHLSTDDEGNAKWFDGTVLCIKPNSNNELVIRYDSFPTLYAFDYEEYHENLVKVIDLEPQQIIGKFIRHRFF